MQTTSSPALLLAKEKGAGSSALKIFGEWRRGSEALRTLRKTLFYSALKILGNANNLIPSPSPCKGEGGRKLCVKIFGGMEKGAGELFIVHY